MELELQKEADLRRSMIEPAREALARPGAVRQYGQTYHITISALTEIAAYLAVSVEVSEPYEMVAPGGRPCAVVKATATRGDGVSCQASGVCEQGEGTSKRKYKAWHACCGMAETRARSRALAALLSPVLAVADPELSATPIEVMPDDGRQRASAKHEVLALCCDDKWLANRLLEWFGGWGEALAFAEQHADGVASAFVALGRETEDEARADHEALLELEGQEALDV